MAAIEEHYPLRDRHTLATDATARFATILTHPKDIETLRENPIWRNNTRLILGGGSNTLFKGDFEGLVIFNAIRGIEVIRQSDEHTWIKIGAGENWHQLVQYCIEHHYAGIENLSLIPGTVGAAPIQNIGAYGVELESVFEELEAIELSTGKIRRFTHADCDFGYRYSVFKHELAHQYCITHVTLRLNKNPIYQLDYGQIRDVLKEMGDSTPPSLRAVSDAVIKIRQQKLPDPTRLPNAGSFFKNPIIENHQLSGLLKAYPTLPHYPHANNYSKVAAAWLIEQCGWRGKRSGPVGVHEHQALVIINYDHGSGKEICDLADTIQKDVHKKFAINLTPEICIV